MIIDIRKDKCISIDKHEGFDFYYYFKLMYWPAKLSDEEIKHEFRVLEVVEIVDDYGYVTLYTNKNNS